MFTLRVNRALATVGLACIFLTLCGCTHRFRITAPAPPAIDPGQYTKDDYDNDVQMYTCATNPVVRADTSQCPTAVTAVANADLAKQARNNIAYGLMTQIDIVYGAYYNQLFAARGTSAVGGDALTLGLSSAATIATHAATKTILSALGTGFSGLSLSVDKNFFAQQTFPVIGVAMQTRRDKVRATIISNLSLDTTQYPLLAVKRDLIAYYNAGTLASGLQELQEEAGSATTPAATGTSKGPSAPTGLIAVPGDSKVNLAWVAPENVASYNLYYSTTAGVTTTNGTKISDIKTNSCIHSTDAAGRPLTNGTAYYYVVTAVNANGESAASNQVSATPNAPGPPPSTGTPSAPVGLSAVAGNSEVTLLWTGSAGATAYNLYYSTTPGDPKTNRNKISDVRSPYTHSTDGNAPLKNGTQYYYVVTAVNASGESDKSNQVSATPKAPPAPERMQLLTPH